MTVTAIVLIILLGLLLILIEFLVTPGVTVAGISGTLLIIGGVFCAYYFQSSEIGHMVLGGSIVVILFLFVLVLKTKTWRKMGLDNAIESKVNTIDENKIHVGDVGKTLSRLAPIGKALIGDAVEEVHSHGELIDENIDIEVSKIEDNKIFVKPKMI